MDSPTFPTPQTGDPEDVVLALETGGALWENGNAAEALRWLRRAADSAEQAGDDMRAVMLARSAADLRTATELASQTPAPPAVAPVAAPIPVAPIAAVAAPETVPVEAASPPPPPSADPDRRRSMPAPPPLPTPGRSSGPPPLPESELAKARESAVSRPPPPRVTQGPTRSVTPSPAAVSRPPPPRTSQAPSVATKAAPAARVSNAPSPVKSVAPAPVPRASAPPPAPAPEPHTADETDEPTRVMQIPQRASTPAAPAVAVATPDAARSAAPFKVKGMTVEVDVRRAVRVAVKHSARDDELYVVRKLADGEAPGPGRKQALLVLLEEV